MKIRSNSILCGAIGIFQVSETVSRKEMIASGSIFNWEIQVQGLLELPYTVYTTWFRTATYLLMV